MLHVGKITCYIRYKKGNVYVWNYVVALLTGTRDKYRTNLFRSSFSKVSLFLLQIQHLNKLNQTWVSSRSHFLVTQGDNLSNSS